MKQFLLKCSGLSLLVCSLIVASLFIVPKQYTNVYTSVLLKKHTRLLNTKGPKIILVGGSSMAFGIDSGKLEKETGMPVVNLGMHAGLGNRFCLEIAKDNINKGDIVIFAPEYFTETELQPELALISCQDNLSLLLDIPAKDRKNVLHALSLYCRKKMFFFITNTGNMPSEIVNEYDPQFFNEYGDNVFPREENVYSVDSVVKEENVFNSEAVSEELCIYLNNFNSYCEAAEATMLVSFAPIVAESVVYDNKEIEKFTSKLSESLNMRIISDPHDYIWPFDKFYGTNFHLNSKGVKLRTDQLILDLQKFR